MPACKLLILVVSNGVYFHVFTLFKYDYAPQID